MTRRSKVTQLAAAGLMTLLVACASTAVDQTWRDENRAPAPMGKTLVIAIAQRDAVRLALENEWIAQLKQRGVEAYPSHTMLGSEGALDKERVLEAVRTNAVRTVLVSRLVRKDTVQTQFPGSNTITPGATGLYYGNWYDYSQTGRTLDSTYTVEHEVAVVETNLYDAQTEKRFWSALSDTFLGESAPDLIRNFVQVMIKQMAKSNVL